MSDLVLAMLRGVASVVVATAGEVAAVRHGYSHS